jgi:anti-sigma factor RsiW
MDRKAAAFVYGHRLHVITLFVFRADGLPWPPSGGEALGPHRLYVRESRGFRTLLWRSGDLGYALVSDTSEADLRELARRITSAGV